MQTLSQLIDKLSGFSEIDFSVLRNFREETAKCSENTDLYIEEVTLNYIRNRFRYQFSNEGINLTLIEGNLSKKVTTLLDIYTGNLEEFTVHYSLVKETKEEGKTIYREVTFIANFTYVPNSSKKVRYNISSVLGSREFNLNDLGIIAKALDHMSRIHQETLENKVPEFINQAHKFVETLAQYDLQRSATD